MDTQTEDTPRPHVYMLGLDGFVSLTEKAHELFQAEQQAVKSDWVAADGFIVGSHGRCDKGEVTMWPEVAESLSAGSGDLHFVIELMFGDTGYSKIHIRVGSRLWDTVTQVLNDLEHPNLLIGISVGKIPGSVNPVEFDTGLVLYLRKSFPDADRCSVYPFGKYWYGDQVTSRPSRTGELSAEALAAHEVTEVVISDEWFDTHYPDHERERFPCRPWLLKQILEDASLRDTWSPWPIAPDMEIEVLDTAFNQVAGQYPISYRLRLRSPEEAHTIAHCVWQAMVDSGLFMLFANNHTSVMDNVYRSAVSLGKICTADYQDGQWIVIAPQLHPVFSSDPFGESFLYPAC